MANNEILQEFAETFDYCAICWSVQGLHIHHLAQGAGRMHEKFNLLRLCFNCHHLVHSGGRTRDVSRGQCLTAKLSSDPQNYDPESVAALRHRVHLGYDPELLSPWMLAERKRHGVPQQVVERKECLSVGKMQRTKGATGEREAAKMLNELVPNALAYRSQQNSGTESSSDVIAPGMPNLWIEVKRVQALAIHKVIEKCREQCGTLSPVVMHRRNGDEWLVTIPLTEINRFSQQIVEAGDG